MKKSTRLLLFTLTAPALGLIATAAAHNVSKTISEQDIDYIHKIAALHGHEWDNIAKHETFADEIKDIRAVQSSVLGLTPLQKQVPNNRTRDPKDLYELRHAQCSDRSRVMDKMLRLSGFETRVASLYSTAKTGSALKSLLSNNKDLVRSHSIVEVKTQEGWMMVDTNDLWLGLDQDMRPVSLEDWQNRITDDPAVWHSSNAGKIYWLLEAPYTYVYGLYSRHGYFYPPYNFVPDINWAEFSQNVF